MTEPRPTLRQLADQANGTAPEDAGSVPTCPACGGALLKYKTITYPTRILRYVRCHNSSCKKRFITKQLPEIILREVVPHTDEDSTNGNPQLILVSDAS